jgi:glycosyltransferase involved in cell wall biosynthesis
MNILWFTWKDTENPLAGGAEVVSSQLAKRLAQDGHTVRFITGGFAGAKTEIIKDGYQINRVGNRYTVYYKASQYYKQNLQGWADIVIDEVNTAPFFSQLYVKEKKVLFFHQLCREIWFYQMIFPLSLIGYLIEPIYLWLLRNNRVITVSNSTKLDLLKYWFKKDNIHIISEGIELEPIKDLNSITKFDKLTVLSLGGIRKMKRTLDIVKAFEIAKNTIPELQLVIAGDYQDSYGDKVLDYIKRSQYQSDIQILGKVSEEKKIQLMQQSHLIAVTSLKEGWGLIVTEANSQGTPAVVYNVDGLRDSVKNKETGYISEYNTPQSLAQSMQLALQDQKQYDIIKQNAWEWSKTITFEQAYKDFNEVISRL